MAMFCIRSCGKPCRCCRFSGLLYETHTLPWLSSQARILRGRSHCGQREQSVQDIEIIAEKPTLCFLCLFAILQNIRDRLIDNGQEQPFCGLCADVLLVLHFGTPLVHFVLPCLNFQLPSNQARPLRVGLASATRARRALPETP